jgi:very-short-patch-repair endonuclease
MTVEELRAQAERAERWPGSLAIHPVLHLADGRLESPGETRSDYLFWQAGLPRPQPQYEIRHADGRVAARVDFAWPDLRVIVEFDGRTKYHRYRREGETIEQMVLREKAREDLVRELTGWTVIRLTWADLSMRVATAARIRRAMRPAAA